ncbi:MAG: hypothetical protein HY927_02270 [Elusimicrobia bacterium]|nr:hypothetical protein [Elusimicrobiota bacterium]
MSWRLRILVPHSVEWQCAFVVPMFLTISTTHKPATDLGFLLHKLTSTPRATKGPISRRSSGSISKEGPGSTRTAYSPSSSSPRTRRAGQASWRP